MSEQNLQSVYHADLPHGTVWQRAECIRLHPSRCETNRSPPLTSATAPRPAAKTVRDRLIDAAEVCLRAKGIRSTTVSEVAEVAGVSRGWLYRHFPDKIALLGAAIVRLNDAYWSESHAMLEQIDGLDEQIAAGIRHGRTAYDDPGALLMKLRLDEPEEFAACAGAGRAGPGARPRRVLVAVPDRRARPRRDPPRRRHRRGLGMGCPRAAFAGHRARDSELDPTDHDAVLTHVRRYVMPGLRADPAPEPHQAQAKPNSPPLIRASIAAVHVTLEANDVAADDDDAAENAKAPADGGGSRGSTD